MTTKNRRLIAGALALTALIWSWLGLGLLRGRDRARGEEPRFASAAQASSPERERGPERIKHLMREMRTRQERATAAKPRAADVPAREAQLGQEPQENVPESPKPLAPEPGKESVENGDEIIHGYTRSALSSVGLTPEAFYAGSAANDWVRIGQALHSMGKLEESDRATAMMLMMAEGTRPNAEPDLALLQEEERAAIAFLRQAVAGAPQEHELAPLLQRIEGRMTEQESGQGTGLADKLKKMEYETSMEGGLGRPHKDTLGGEDESKDEKSPSRDPELEVPTPLEAEMYEKVFGEPHPGAERKAEAEAEAETRPSQP